MLRKLIAIIVTVWVVVLSPMAMVSANHGAVKQIKVAMLIPGDIKDGGFMQAGYEGLLKIQKDLAVETTYIDGVKPEIGALSEALRKLAKEKPDLIIAHGGQCSQAAKKVSAEYPEIKFAVVQGNVTGSNLSSYEVLQEESAWLAGAAAGLLTKTGIVGHISGIRVTPGLKGRAAYADGLRYTNPTATLLTSFAGNQDDNALSRKVAQAQIDGGADILFTMLNAGRTGAIEACKENNVHQIGNVKDWVKVEPTVFIGSAIANVSMAAYAAGDDLVKGTWKSGEIKKIGLANRDAVRLTVAPSIPADVAATLERLANKIAAGEIKVSTVYEGPEFQAY